MRFNSSSPRHKLALICMAFSQTIPGVILSAYAQDLSGITAGALGQSPSSSSSTPSKSSYSSTPSSASGATGRSVYKPDRAADEPALKVSIKYIQHQKIREKQSGADVDNSTPLSLLPPSTPSNSSSTPNASGDITLSQAIFSGYISFLSMGRQFGAIQFDLPMRTLKSDYAQRASGTEFGGTHISLVAGEKGVGSFGVGAQLLQSQTLKLFQKHQNLSGHFYLERGSLSATKNKTHFMVQAGPEISVPLQNNDPNTTALEYAPMYGGKVLIGYATPFAFNSPLRMQAFAQLFRVNSVKVNKQEKEGGGLIALGTSIDYNLSGNLWLGIEGNYALAKPEGREYIFGNPELPALYGHSVSAFVQAAAF